MDESINNIVAGDMQAAAGITRDELLVWQKQGLLKIPPANPDAGRARRYGLANLIEAAVLKACISKGVPHEVASEMVVRRLSMAINKKWAGGGGYEEFTQAFYNDPRAVLEGTEFDPNAKPFMSPEDASLFMGHCYWTFIQKGRNIEAASLMEQYDRVVTHAPMWAKHKAEHNTPEGYGPEEDPIETVKGCVLDALNQGGIVVEIRQPIRKAIVYVYGSFFWPGRFPELA